MISRYFSMLKTVLWLLYIVWVLLSVTDLRNCLSRPRSTPLFVISLRMHRCVTGVIKQPTGYEAPTVGQYCHQPEVVDSCGEKKYIILLVYTTGCDYEPYIHNGPIMTLCKFKPLMMTSWHWNAFRIIGPLWGESTGHRWIPFTKSQ